MYSMILKLLGRGVSFISMMSIALRRTFLRYLLEMLREMSHLRPSNPLKRHSKIDRYYDSH